MQSHPGLCVDTILSCLLLFVPDKTRPPAPGLVGSELEAERATETENTLGGSWASDGGATAEAAAKEAEEDLQARLGGLLNGNTGTVA